jgi:7-cyano-7-deazaguanine synthase
MPAADCVVIVSGGMDSVTLLHELVKRQRRHPAVISFSYGQKHRRELNCAREQVRRLGPLPHLILDLGSMSPLFGQSALVGAAIPIPDLAQVEGDPQPPTYVPNRNMIFLSLAAAYAETTGIGDIFYGAQRHDLYGYWDTTAAFLSRINQLFALNRANPVRVLAPFVHKSKADILRLGLSLQVDYAFTWSCYGGEELACGRCPTCAERLAAFTEVDLPDPVPYAARPAQLSGQSSTFRQEPS